MNAKPTVLVTGSSGFIGHHMVTLLLSQSYHVVALDRVPPSSRNPAVDYVLCDINDYGPLEEAVLHANPTYIIHLAARTDLDEHRDIRGYDTNIRGVNNLLQVAESLPCLHRAIYTSTQLVCRVGYIPRNSTDYLPSTLYGLSKVLGEDAVRSRDGGGRGWCIVRPTTVWGPGMSLHYRGMFELIMKGYYFHVGGQHRYKSYGYVKNVAYQYGQLLRAPAQQVDKQTFYLADYMPIDLHDWTNSFQKAFGAPLIPTVPLWAGYVAAFVGDTFTGLGFDKFPLNSFRLRNILTQYVFCLDATEGVCGPLPYSFQQGICETAEWYTYLSENLTDS